MSELTATTSPQLYLPARKNAYGSDLADITRFYGLGSDKSRMKAAEDMETLQRIAMADDGKISSTVEDIERAFVNSDSVAAQYELNHFLSRRLRLSYPGGRFERFTTWVQKASVDDFAKFAMWHQRRHQRFQDQLEQSRPELTAQSMEYTEKLIGIGMLPPAASNIMQTAMAAAAYKAIDFIEAGSAPYAAYWFNGNIGVSNLFTNPYQHTGISDEFQSIALHEHIHSINALGYGFINGIDTRVPYSLLTEEMFATHASLVALDKGDAALRRHIIKPSLRNDGSEYHYGGERDFYAEIDGLAIDLVGAACFSHPGSKARGMLEKYINKRLYPHTIIDVSTAHMQKRSYTQRSALMAQYAQKLAEQKVNSTDNPAPSTQYQLFIGRQAALTTIQI